MSNQDRPLFDSSFGALVLVNARGGAKRPPTALTPGRRRLTGGSSTAMSIRFAPEPEPSGNIVDLGEGQTTGPLPLGFEFEFFGVGYTWFDLSSDGFLTFGTHSFPCCPGSHPRSRFIPLSADLNNFIALGWTDGCRLSRRQVAYEVRGAAQRRRLVLSLSRVPASPEDGLGTLTAQLVLHERTGMIDIYTTRQDLVASRVDREAIRFTTAPW
ncbi:MAG TPA: hypothetical protein VGQ24_15055 [Gemmatimonadales bacterium]|nr:hypothetical protein [Gemmatimonadales bacterium]